uniref:Titin n=1 Tax=Anopheles minimus TaxID=112268 RepID=A0A182VTU9_9DIPT
MGFNNRDKQAKLKTQSLLDSERAGQQTVTTVTVDHGTIAMPLESMAVSSSTTSNSSSSYQQSSSSSSTKVQSSAEKLQKSTEGRASEVRELSSKKDGQKFSSVSSMRSEASKSKQIDNIIEEIHHIASDTIGTAAMIGASAGSELPAKVTQRTVLVGGGESGRKESFVSDSAVGGHTTVSSVSGDTSHQVISTIGPSKIEISKMALDSSALSSVSSSTSHKVMQSSSAITQKDEHQQASHSAVRSEKNVSESSAISSSQKTESKSSKTIQSSSTSSSKSMSTAQSKTAQSTSETFQTSALGENVQSSKSTASGRQNGVLSVDGKQSSTVHNLPDHSTFDQKSFQLVDADGKTRQQVDSQSFSMAQSQAPTTKVLYDAAGNKITSTSASYQAAQGYSTSSFQSSEGVDMKPSTIGKLVDGDGKTRQHVGSQSQTTYDTAGNMTTNTSSSYQTAQGYSSSSFHTSEGVDHKSSNDILSSSSTKRAQNVASSKSNLSSTAKDSIIDSTTLDNYSVLHDSATGQHSNNMLMKTESAHTVASLSSAHDSLASTIQSTQLITESASQAEQRQQHSESSKTIETSSYFAQMDEESRSRRKTSEYREQRESNAAILKRKTYDEHGRRLNLIDEKIVSKDTVTADLQDDVTNVTKTSFEAKIFNPKLKRWELVDQKTIFEKDITTDIPVEIVQELEVERPELANITTTIQMTKVYDAKTKQWKTIDQKKHIDVLEKITFLEESSKRSDLDESERIKNLKSMDMVDRVTIKEVSDLSDAKQSQTSKTTKRKDEQSIQEQCICEICTCGRHNCYNCGGGTTTTQTKSSKYTAMSNSENFYHQENFASELSAQKSSGRRGTWTIEDAEDHLNRRESYTIERSSTTQEVSDRRLTWTKEDFEKLDIAKLKADYVRPKPIKHEDNLKPEGDFNVPERTAYIPGERVKPIRHDDNLRPEGEFSTPDKPQYRPAERPKQVRPEDNLRPEGDFSTPEKHQYRPAERPKQIKPEDNLRTEGAFHTPERPEYRPGERSKP